MWLLLFLCTLGAAAFLFTLERISRFIRLNSGSLPEKNERERSFAFFLLLCLEAITAKSWETYRIPKQAAQRFFIGSWILFSFVILGEMWLTLSLSFMSYVVFAQRTSTGFFGRERLFGHESPLQFPPCVKTREKIHNHDCNQELIKASDNMLLGALRTYWKWLSRLSPT